MSTVEAGGVAGAAWAASRASNPATRIFFMDVHNVPSCKELPTYLASTAAKA